MSQTISVKFNEENRRKKKRAGQFPIECYVHEIGRRTGRRLNKRHVFYGGHEVAQRELSSLVPGENRFIGLQGQNLTNLDLSGVDFRNADLSETVCHYTDFSGAKMDGANIEGADLTGARISSEQLRKTTGKPYAYPYGRGVTATKMAALRKVGNNRTP